MEGGSLGLYEIDLSTGENRKLGGEPLSSGFSLMPCLSPDGKTLAVLHKGTDSRILESRVHLIDAATGNARPLGQPLDTAFISWFPDGKHLLLITRKHVTMDHPSQNSLARMDLQGKVSTICRGDVPVLIDQSKRILFEGEEDDLWYTCDLTGKNRKRFHGGFARHGFPAPSPTGTQVLMMRFSKTGMPRPVIIDVRTGTIRSLTVPEGLWATPKWQ
jgi:Tol biopolymer transport system component